MPSILYFCSSFISIFMRLVHVERCSCVLSFVFLLFYYRLLQQACNLGLFLSLISCPPPSKRPGLQDVFKSGFLAVSYDRA